MQFSILCIRREGEVNITHGSADGGGYQEQVPILPLVLKSRCTALQTCTVLRRDTARPAAGRIGTAACCLVAAPALLICFWSCILPQGSTVLHDSSEKDRSC